MNYYNEFDPKAAAWLRELISEGLIPYGTVDERSITEVSPTDLAGYTQCHFFAGIGGWPYALRLAGWPDDRPVWTGSCPCQPFSCAGKGLATADERHLWPAFFRLIDACRPPVVFGEQVASSAVLGKAWRRATGEVEPVWLDGVFADLEAAHYTCGAADIPAASVGAPHIRQRLFWVAVAQQHGRGTRSAPESRCESGAALTDSGVTESRVAYAKLRRSEQCNAGERGVSELDPNGANGRLADAECGGHGEYDSPVPATQIKTGRGLLPSCPSCGKAIHVSTRPCHTRWWCALCDTEWDREPVGRLGDTTGCRPARKNRTEQQEQGLGTGRNPGFWSSAIWHECRDGKARRIPRPEPGVLGMAHGLPEGVDAGWLESGFPLAPKIQGRVQLLKGYGNAIVPQLAAEFILASLDAIADDGGS